MKNKEKYHEKMLEVFSEGGSCEFKQKYILKKGNCRGYSCQECSSIVRAWYEEEYVEKIKLSKTEKAILESIYDEWKWIARDKNCDLFLFKEKPYKYDYGWTCDKECTDFIAFNHLFSFIQWEDDEPLNIEKLLKNITEEE